MKINQMYDLSITYTYRSGSQFTEHFAKPQRLDPMSQKVEAARQRLIKESNIVKAEYRAVPLDTKN